MPDQIDFAEETAPSIDFLSDEDALTAGAKATDQALNAVDRSLQLGALAAPEPPAPAPIVPPTLAGVGQVPVAPPALARQILGAPFRAAGGLAAGLARSARDVVSPTTFLPEEEQERLRPFVIDTRGNEIRPMRPAEVAEREPIQVGRPLFTAPRTQLQPESSDLGRIVEEWSSPEGIAMIATGNINRLIGYYALASMAPGLIDDVKTVASSSATPEEKRDRINNAFALAGMIAGHPAAREMREQRARDEFYQDEMAVPPPITLTGAELPGLPKGFAPLRTVAGAERLGPPIPPARVRTMTEAQANLPGGQRPIAGAPETRESMVAEIKRRGLVTKEQIKAAFPWMSREEAAAWRRRVVDERQGPPLPPPAEQQGPPLPQPGPITMQPEETVNEIRRRNLQTVDEVLGAMPKLRGQNERQRAEQLLRRAWGNQPPPPRPPGVRTGPLQGPDRVVAGTRQVVRPMGVDVVPDIQGPQIPPEVQAQREREANMQREIEARRSALQQMIIFWERELEMARNRGDKRGEQKAVQMLLNFRQEYEAIPPVKTIEPKPPIPRAPGRPFRPIVPETPTESGETAAQVVRRKNIKTIEALLDEFPQMRGTGGAREWARNILREIWGAFPPGVIQGPPLPPSQEPPKGPEEPPATPPGPTVPKPPGAPPEAPAAPAPAAQGHKWLDNPELYSLERFQTGTPRDLLGEGHSRHRSAVIDAFLTKKPVAVVAAADQDIKPDKGYVKRGQFWEYAGGTKPTPPATEPPQSETEPAKPATIEDTPIAGKTLGEWEAVRDASQLPKGNARAELARYLAVPNQPSRILQALANKKRTREIHKAPVSAEEVSAVPPPEEEPPEEGAAPTQRKPPTPPAAPGGSAHPLDALLPEGVKGKGTVTPAGVYVTPGLTKAQYDKFFLDADKAGYEGAGYTQKGKGPIYGEFEPKKTGPELEIRKLQARIGRLEAVAEMSPDQAEAAQAEIAKLRKEIEDLQGPAKTVEEPQGMKPEVKAEVDRILATIEDNQTSVRALEQLRDLKNRDQLTIDQFADLEKQVAKLRIEGIRKFNPEVAYFEEQKPAMDAIMAQVGKGPGRQISESGAMKDVYRYVTDALNAAQRRKVRDLAAAAGWRFTRESDVDPSYGRGLKTLSFKPPVAKKTSAAAVTPPEPSAGGSPVAAAAPEPTASTETATAKAQKEVTKVAQTEGQRPANEVKQDLIDGLQQALMKAPREVSDKKPTVTIAIPGDGTFKVKNAVEPISEVLDRAKKIETNPNKPFKMGKKQIEASSKMIAKTAGANAELRKQREAEEARAKGKPSMGPGAAAAAEFEQGPMPPPNPAVYGLDAGNRWYNERRREFDNIVQGMIQLGQGRGVTKKFMAQSLNAARTQPPILGQQAGNAFRLKLKNVREQNAVTALMQAFKRSGEGVDPEDAQRPGMITHPGDPMGYLRDNQTDLETYAQEQINKGKRLEAQAAIDLAQAMQYARDHFAELKPVAIEAKKRLDEQIKSEEARGLETDYERWYVPQRHDLDLLPAANRPMVLAAGKGPGPTGQFRKPKYYEDYSSAIQAGFIPRSLSIADLIEHRVRTGEGLAYHKAFFESLRRLRDPKTREPVAMNIPKRNIKDADGNIVKTVESVPLGYEAFQITPGIRMAIHKNYSRMLRALTGSSPAADSAAIAAAQNVAAIEKHIGLALDTFHSVRTALTEFFTTMRNPFMPWTGRVSLAGERLKRGTALLEYDIADLDRAVQEGKLSQAAANWIRNPQKWEVGGRTIDASPRAVINYGIKNGLTIGRIADAIYKDWLRQIPVFGDVNRYVFDLQTRAAMSHGFLAEFRRVAKENPQLNANQVARQVASDINVLFGNLQKESWIRSPSLNAWAQIFFLAPNWVQSRIRTEGRGAMQLGEAAGRLVRGKAPQLGTAGKTVGSGLLGSFMAAQVLNLITRHQLTFQNPEPEHKLDAFIPDPYGKGFFFSPLALFAELAHDAYRYSFTHPDMASVLDQIMKNKLGNIGRATWIAALGRDPFTDQKVIGTANRLGQAAYQAVPSPIFLSSAFRELGEVIAPGKGRAITGSDVLRQAASTFGIKIEPAGSAQSEVRRMVDRWKMTQEPKLQADVERRLHEDFHGPYSDLRQALSRKDFSRAEAIYRQLREDGATPKKIRDVIRHPHPFAGSKVLEHRFFNSLNDEQKALYREAVKEREEIATRFAELTK